MYHVNTLTKKKGLCHAKSPETCPLTSTGSPHFETAEEADAYVAKELEKENGIFSTHKKVSESNFFPSASSMTPDEAYGERDVRFAYTGTSQMFDRPLRTDIPLTLAYKTKGPEIHAEGCSHSKNPSPDRYMDASKPFDYDNACKYTDDFYYVAPCAKGKKPRVKIPGGLPHDGYTRSGAVYLVDLNDWTDEQAEADISARTESLRKGGPGSQIELTFYTNSNAVDYAVKASNEDGIEVAYKNAENRNKTPIVRMTYRGDE